MSMIAVLGLACAGSVGAMAGALAVAASPAGWRSRLQPLLLAYSAGTLLAAALLGMQHRCIGAVGGKAIEGLGTIVRGGATAINDEKK